MGTLSICFMDMFKKSTRYFSIDVSVNKMSAQENGSHQESEIKEEEQQVAEEGNNPNPLIIDYITYPNCKFTEGGIESCARELVIASGGS